MPDDARYFRALTAAMEVLVFLRIQPDAPNHVILSRLVFAILSASCNGGGLPTPDDSRFLAASHAAMAIAALFGSVADADQAERVGRLTFLLLELMGECRPGEGLATRVIPVPEPREGVGCADSSAKR